MLLKKVVAPVIFIFFLCAMNMALAQDQMKESLFKEVMVLLSDAEKVNASLYSPTYFQKGYDLYSRAEKDFQEGKKLEDIRNRLKEAASNLKKSIEITRMSKLTLEEITSARNDAIEQQAPEWAPTLYQKAEETFRRAAEKVEDGKTNDAANIATEGSRLFRETELAAIKNRILNDARAELKKCAEQEVVKYAPQTLRKATALAATADSVLSKDRYDQENAIAYAEDAAYEARHALYLASVIKDFDKQKEGTEKYLLDVENQFSRIAEALNLEMEFDGGFQGPAYKMVETILDLKEKDQNQQKKIEELSTTVNDLSNELSNLKSGKLPELSGKLAELEKIVAAEREAKERFERVRQNFAPTEAKIVQEGENIIIRLYGINFPSGRAIIRPEYFPLLTKVIKSINEFPGASVRIEGHTDSRGSNAVNEKLSSDRANSVVQYVVANSNIEPAKITAIGYGEDRPIASNDTEEGQALNRRIDVVIMPQRSN